MVAALLWIAAAVPGRQAARRAHRRAAGHHQLVVRPQRAGAVVHAGERRRHLLLPAEDHRPAGALVQPVDPGLLDAGVLLRPGRRPPPDRRPGAGLAHHAVDRAEPDDGDPGDRVQHQHGRHAAGPHAPGALFAHAALHDVRRADVLRLVGAGLAGGAAQREPGRALHPLHGGACAPGRLRLRDHGAVRRHLLHDAARAELGVAVPAPDHAALLAGRRRHRDLLRGAHHRRLAAGRGHARRGAALHGVGDA